MRWLCPGFSALRPHSPQAGEVDAGQTAGLCSTPQAAEKAATGAAGKGDTDSRQELFSVVINFREIKTRAQNRFSVEVLSCKQWGIFFGNFRKTVHPLESQGQQAELSEISPTTTKVVPVRKLLVHEPTTLSPLILLPQPRGHPISCLVLQVAYT